IASTSKWRSTAIPMALRQANIHIYSWYCRILNYGADVFDYVLSCTKLTISAVIAALACIGNTPFPSAASC
ncbi:hypothetical protein, partial [Microbacterium schleiferi]|uniref:hypothetical protein n=1 Tax=Microbacterium schleiferi TaxID=69362 RepID=UPI0031D3D211